MMVGLPRSGKSTIAKQLGHPIVNPDSIRLALHGQAFFKEAEPMVWAIAKYMVNALFLAGHDDVILDATNLTLRRRNEWRSNLWARHYHVVSTPKEVCQARAYLTQQDYLIPVINRMFKEYESVALSEKDIGSEIYFYGQEDKEVPQGIHTDTA